MILLKDDALLTSNHRHPSILWQVSTRDSTSADMYHPVHGTARLTKSTHYCCQLLALPLNINGQQQCINLKHKHRVHLENITNTDCSQAISRLSLLLMKGNAAILINRIPAAPDATIDGLLWAANFKTVPNICCYIFCVRIDLPMSTSNNPMRPLYANKHITPESLDSPK